MRTGVNPFAAQESAQKAVSCDAISPSMAESELGRRRAPKGSPGDL